MRSFIRRVTATAVLLASIASAHTSAQTIRFFDPNDKKACDKAVGPPADDSNMSGIAWDLDCAEFDINLEESDLAALRRVEENSSTAERESFRALWAAFRRYKSLRLDYFKRGCGGGNACPAYTSQEEATINYDFLILVQRLRQSSFPFYSAKDYSAADTALNKKYRSNLMSNLPKSCRLPTPNDDQGIFCVSQADFRAVERAWIRYRDAWVDFAAKKWPQVSADSVRTYLTLQQTKAGW